MFRVKQKFWRKASILRYFHAHNITDFIEIGCRTNTTIIRIMDFKSDLSFGG